MEEKIAELEKTTIELHKNREMLIEASRYSTLGQMTAQRHTILKSDHCHRRHCASAVPQKPSGRIPEIFRHDGERDGKGGKILSDLSLFVESTKPSYELVSLAEKPKIQFSSTNKASLRETLQLSISFLTISLTRTRSKTDATGAGCTLFLTPLRLCQPGAP